MSFEDAERALGDAIESDNTGAETSAPAPAPVASPEQAVQPSTPEGPTTPEGVTPEQPRDDHGRFKPVEGEQAASEDTFTTVDPSTLPPELLPVYRSMLGDYTRKTQEIAPYRRLAEEHNLDAQELAEALNTYDYISDPDNWVDLHRNLSAELERTGMTPREASAEATRQMEDAQAPRPATPDLGELANDPEMAPLANMLQGLQGELSSLRDDMSKRDKAVAEQEAAVQEEQLQQALIGELTRQESLIRQNNPAYQDDDVDFVYELSSYHEGNLLQAQERLEQYFNNRLARYFEQKARVASAPEHQPISGGGAASAVLPETSGDSTTDLDKAHQAALEHVAGLETVDWS
jgi:hypothetical protein